MKDNNLPFVEIFTDGACSGNPGIGGYGILLRSGDKKTELSGCEKLSTNNRMEMLGAVSALEALKRPCSVRITTDSNYVVKGMTQWMNGWLKNNWINSQRKEVMNRDLWERLLRASQRHKVEWVWIKGHDGHEENERCDKLAREAIKKCRQRMRDEKT